MTNGTNPHVHHTVLVAAFEGWNDAGNASSDAVRSIINSYDAHTVATIDSDDFYDLQLTRPCMCTATGRQRIVWPQTTFYETDMSDSLTLILALGPEPNLHWMDYCHSFLRIAEDADVDQLYLLSSMFEDTPHTRPLPLSIDDGADLSVDSQTYSGPVGVPTVLNMVAAQNDIESHSVWVSVPQYVGDGDCPQGSMTLVTALWKALGVTHWKDGDQLRQKAQEWVKQTSEVVKNHEVLSQHIALLEQEYDDKARKDMLAEAGGDVADEAEQFLQSLDEKSQQQHHANHDKKGKQDSSESPSTSPSQ
jgi:hypothetical protein